MGQPVGRKVAIVTGGGSGIGRAAVERFVREGFGVAIWDTAEQGAAATLAEAEAQGADAVAIKVDVSVVADVKNAIDETVEKFGRIDVLVNCAGFVQRSDPLDVDNWNRHLGVMLTGAYIASTCASEEMMKSGGGSIVNIASTSALTGESGPAYSAAKGGLISLSRSLAVALARYRIRVNSVLPGPVATSMLGRAPGGIEGVRARLAKQMLLGMAAPQQIASVIYFLSSEDASHITGTEILVDGGFMLGRAREDRK